VQVNPRSTGINQHRCNIGSTCTTGVLYSIQTYYTFNYGTSRVVIYLQIEAFYKAYEAYCGGVRSSIRLLVELKKSSEFEAFLKSAECNGQLTLSSVLKKPIEVSCFF